MRKKTTSQVICQNFKLPHPETIFQDYKCTFKASITFFGRLYIGEEHFLFISNMFGIVKKCIIQIQRVKKVQLMPNGSVLILQLNKQSKQKKDLPDSQYVFGSFKNGNAFKLMEALWKRQKIQGDILKTEDQEGPINLIYNDAQVQHQKQIPIPSLISQGKIQANFFNHQAIQNQYQKIVDIILPCSPTQFYQFFLSNTATIYPRKKHLELKNSRDLLVTDWRKSTQFVQQSSEVGRQVRQLTGVLRLNNVPFMNSARLSQVWMLKKKTKQKQQIQQLEYSVVTSMQDLPYTSYFTMNEITKVTPYQQAKNKCNMKVQGALMFNKTTSMKNMIINRTLGDLKEDYSFWIKNVEEALQKLRKKNQQDSKINLPSVKLSEKDQKYLSKQKIAMKEQPIEKLKQGGLQYEQADEKGRIILQNIKKLQNSKVYSKVQNSKEYIGQRIQINQIKNQIHNLKNLAYVLIFINIIQLIIAVY